MGLPEPHAPETRSTAEALIREGIAVAEIAKRIGLPFGTVYRWKRSLAAPKGRRRAIHPVCPDAWPARRRAAVGRLLARPEVDANDLAQALGGTRREGRDLKRALGVPRLRRPAVRKAAPGLGDLNTALRAHLGRQIAALDTRLKVDDRKEFDSGKALRDLGGLKRLLDQLAEAEQGRDGGKRKIGRARDEDGDADGGAQEDLAVLRDRIARRIAAFAGDWPPDRVSGEPAAAAPDDDRP